MYNKLIFIIIILVFSSISTYSALIEQDVNFVCQNGTSLKCCPLLAHSVASQHNSRCATITLINKSGYNMTLDLFSLEDGRWVTSYDYDDNNIDINCEPRSLPNNQSEAISSVTSHFLGGIKGYIVFVMDDDISSNLVISWDVPTVGSPAYFFYFSDKLSEKNYTIETQSSLGDTAIYVTVYPKTELYWNTTVFFPILILLFCVILFMVLSGGQKSDSFGQQRQQSYNSFGQQGQQYYNPSGQQRQQYYNPSGQQRQQSYNAFGQQRQQSYNDFEQPRQQKKHTYEYL